MRTSIWCLSAALLLVVCISRCVARSIVELVSYNMFVRYLPCLIMTSLNLYLVHIILAFSGCNASSFLDCFFSISFFLLSLSRLSSHISSLSLVSSSSLTSLRFLSFIVSFNFSFLLSTFASILFIRLYYVFLLSFLKVRSS